MEAIDIVSMPIAVGWHTTEERIRISAGEMFMYLGDTYKAVPRAVGLSCPNCVFGMISLRCPNVSCWIATGGSDVIFRKVQNG
jgi:hypothetical protein